MKQIAEMVDTDPRALKLLFVEPDADPEYKPHWTAKWVRRATPETYDRFFSHCMIELNPEAVLDINCRGGLGVYPRKEYDHIPLNEVPLSGPHITNYNMIWQDFIRGLRWGQKPSYLANLYGFFHGRTWPINCVWVCRHFLLMCRKDQYLYFGMDMGRIMTPTDLRAFAIKYDRIWERR